MQTVNQEILLLALLVLMGTSGMAQAATIQGMVGYDTLNHSISKRQADGCVAQGDICLPGLPGSPDSCCDGLFCLDCPGSPACPRLLGCSPAAGIACPGVCISVSCIPDDSYSPCRHHSDCCSGICDVNYYAVSLRDYDINDPDDRYLFCNNNAVGPCICRSAPTTTTTLKTTTTPRCIADGSDSRCNYDSDCCSDSACYYPVDPDRTPDIRDIYCRSGLCRCRPPRTPCITDGGVCYSTSRCCSAGGGSICYPDIIGRSLSYSDRDLYCNNVNAGCRCRPPDYVRRDCDVACSSDDDCCTRAGHRCCLYGDPNYRGRCVDPSSIFLVEARNRCFSCAGDGNSCHGSSGPDPGRCCPGLTCIHTTTTIPCRACTGGRLTLGPINTNTCSHGSCDPRTTRDCVGGCIADNCRDITCPISGYRCRPSGK